MKKNITILPGDGIGPEVIDQAIKVIEAVNTVFDHEFKLEHALMGAVSIDAAGEAISDETLVRCEKSDAVLLGAIGDPKYDNNPELKVRPEQGLLKLRKTLELFSNVRPISTYDILKDVSPLKERLLNNVDLVIYRDLTGGIYFGEKTRAEDGSSASDLCTYTSHEISRIAYQAFEAASNRKKKLTLVDKANVLETSRLWRKVVQDISTEYPDVEVDYMFVDNAAMQVMLAPSSFDVILTENMFGDIISDLASVIIGSLGMLASASVGNKTALFEPIHGSFPQAKGLDMANPMATILSVAMMYDHFKLYDEAELIRSAVNWAIEHKIVTQDIAGDGEAHSCSKVGDLIAHYLEEQGNVEMKKDSINMSLNCII
jgi:3-isopropylmalate dehydrogenase